MDTPQVLLEHYLKQLKLPTMLREYVKLAEQCAKEGVDFQRFLLRLVEAEMLERERKATERRIKAARFAVVKSLETFEYLAIPSLNKSWCWNWRGVSGLGGGTTSCVWAIPGRGRLTSRWRLGWQRASGDCGFGSRPRRR